jgi:hypothetical protein
MNISKSVAGRHSGYTGITLTGVGEFLELTLIPFRNEL